MLKVLLVESENSFRVTHSHTYALVSHIKFAQVGILTMPSFNLLLQCPHSTYYALIQLIVEQGMSIIPDDRLFVTLIVKCLMVHAGKQIPSAMCCLRLVLNLLKISLCFLENFLREGES